MTKLEKYNTAEKYQKLGEDSYVLAESLKNSKIPQSQKTIDATWGVASSAFWSALVLGGNKAPIWLFKCFAHGFGVKKDEDIATLMYGVALKFTPKDCAKILDNRKSAISKPMRLRINTLVKLIKDTQALLPKEGADASIYLDQLTKFNDGIELPSGKTIESCFIEGNIQEKTNEKAIEAHVTKIKENLQKDNKISPPPYQSYTIYRKKALSKGSRCIIS